MKWSGKTTNTTSRAFAKCDAFYSLRIINLETGMSFAVTKIANAARIINLAKEEKDKLTKTENALG